MKELVLDFEPGSLKVYKIMSFRDHGNGQPSAFVQYAWCDAKSPEGFGPFNTIVECLNHHIAVSREDRPEALDTPKDNVIYVDFVNRKRANVG